MIIDTNIIIKKYRKSEEIKDNITIVSAMEFPPVLKYEKFQGATYTIKPEDQLATIKLQRKLRKIGKPKSVPDLLIAAICINQNEVLQTNDEDFWDISRVSELEVKSD